MKSKLTGRWVVAFGLAGLTALAGDAVGVPSPELLAGLVAGVVVALGTDWALSPLEPVFTGSQVILGIIAGAYFEESTLGVIGSNAPAILAISIATLGLSVAAGLLLARISPLDRPTAAFGTIAGGASGIVAIANELGADNRLVAVMQYLRVFVILALMPVVAEVFFSAEGGVLPAKAGDALGIGSALLFIAVCTAPGLLMDRFSSIPAGALLGPMIAAAVLKLAGVSFAGPLPTWMQDLALVALGLQVGIRFTPESLRNAGRALLPGMAVILAMLAGCGFLGFLLASLTEVSQLDAYLATTPGGLYAVVGVAVNTGSDATFVTTVQVLRVFIMLLAAPLLARWISPASPPGCRRQTPDV